MHTPSLISHITRCATGAIFISLSCTVQAQISYFHNFIQQHFHTYSAESQDGPKLLSKFDYSDDNSIFTQNIMNVNHDGFMNDMSVGLLQNYGPTIAKISYNLQNIKFTNLEHRNDNLLLDIHYHGFSLKQHIKPGERSSRIAMPVNFGAMQMNFSYTQTHNKDTEENIDVYGVETKVKDLKFFAKWENTEVVTWSDYITKLQPTKNWQLVYGLYNHGTNHEQDFRGIYNDHEYRFISEHKIKNEGGEQNHYIGTFSIENTTSLAVVNMRLEYDNTIDTPSIFFGFETPLH